MDPIIVAKFIYRQFFVTPQLPKTDYAGKTVCVTGSNVGLGKEAVRHIVRLGAEKVILACRSTDKGEAAKKDIETSTGKKGVIEVWSLDLCNYDSVRAFAKRLDGLERLDVLIENAGIAGAKFALQEGHESTITTNVISTFLLALLVLPTLKRTANNFNTTPVLTIVSSEVHTFTTFPEKASAPGQLFADLSDPKQARMDDRYQVSKLLEVYACREIAAQHPKPKCPVTVNFLNPGFCHSELSKEPGLGMKLMKLLLARTTEVGSRTLVSAGAAGEETHGQYLSDCKITTPGIGVVGPGGKEVQQRVWKELCVELEKIEPGVTGNL